MNAKKSLKKLKDSSKKDNPNKRRSLYLINMIVLSLITIFSCALSFFFLFRAKALSSDLFKANSVVSQIREHEKTVYSAQEVEEIKDTMLAEGEEKGRHAVLMQIQSSLESGNSTLSMLREMFSDDLVVVNGGKYYFYPVLDKLEKNFLKADDFRMDDTGFLTYQGDGSVIVQRGIDVSDKNGKIDWKAVADDGIGFCMVHAGKRNEEGKIVLDETFQDNLNGAVKNDISVGVYYELGAISLNEEEEEAQALIDLLKPYQSDIHYPVAVVVNMPESGSKLSGLTRSEWTDYLIDFCDRIKEAGYKSMIGGNTAALIMETSYDRLEKYDKWVMSNDATLYFPYKISMWQYSGSGTVQGITGDVNLDIQVTQR